MSTYQPRQKLEVQIDAASFGTSGILLVLDELKQSDIRIYWDVFLINVLTILRNNLTPQISDADALRNTVHDLNVLTQHLGEFLQHHTPLIRPPIVVVYLPSYEKLPLVHSRHKNAQAERVQRLTEYLRKQMDPPGSETTKSTLRYELAVYEAQVGKRHFPHVELAEIVKTILRLQQVHIRPQVGLISHVPLDFHLQNFYGKNLTLLESHTGRLIEPATFGEKVFKNPHVPFNRYTHLLFGDTTHVKPLVARKEKQLFLDQAARNRWRVKTTEQILTDIKHMNLMPLNMLTTIPL